MRSEFITQESRVRDAIKRSVDEYEREQQAIHCKSDIRMFYFDVDI